MQKRTILLLIIGLSLIVVSVLAIFFARPLWHGYKKFQAHKLTEDATKIIDTDISRFADAESIARDAYRIWPYDIEVMRLIARIYEIRGIQSKVFEFRKQIIEFSDCSKEDRQRFIESALDTYNYRLARAELSKFLSRYAEDDAVSLSLAVRVYNAVADYDRSLRELNKILKQDVNYPIEEFFFYTEHGVGPYESKRLLFSAILKKIADHRDIVALRMLRYFATNSLKTSIEDSEMGRLLSEHPQANKEDALLAVSLLYKARQMDAKSAVSALQKRLNLKSEDDLRLLGKYLNRMGLYAETLKYVGADVLNKEVFLLLRLEAVCGLKDWKELERMTDASSGSSELLRYLYQTVLYRETGRADMAKSSWMKVLFATERNVDKKWYVADFAKKHQWRDLQEIVLAELCKLPFASRKAYGELCNMYYTAKDVDGLLKVYEEMAERFPYEADVLTGFYYTSLLVNEDINTVLRDAESLLKIYPEYTALKLTLALAYFRNGMAREALDTISGTSYNWMDLSASNKLVAAVVLQANGQVKNAQLLIDAIKNESLLPEELKLLKP